MTSRSNDIVHPTPYGTIILVSMTPCLVREPNLDVFSGFIWIRSEMQIFLQYSFLACGCPISEIEAPVSNKHRENNSSHFLSCTPRILLLHVHSASYIRFS